MCTQGVNACVRDNWKGVTENFRNPLILGGAKRDRTADLLNAIQALSQLSYSPVRCGGVYNKSF